MEKKLSEDVKYFQEKKQYIERKLSWENVIIRTAIAKIVTVEIIALAVKIATAQTSVIVQTNKKEGKI